MDTTLLTLSPLAYIGPGAGFAVLGSFVVLLGAIVLSVVTLLFWPFRALCRLFTTASRRKTGIRRVVILGLDGLDPDRCKRLMAEGRLPHLEALARTGSFTRLQSTCPPISPVAWSSFMTGVNPGKHRIFDFLARDLSTYLPELSSCRIETTRQGRQDVRPLRRSRPFWNVLADHGVHSTVLRIPITYPPEPFEGLLLSGMCVPDLLGTQGTFTCFSEDGGTADGVEGGRRVQLVFENDEALTTVSGPTITTADGEQTLAVPMRIKRRGSRVHLCVSGKDVCLDDGAYSEWIHLQFPRGRLRKVHGICRFYVTQKADGLRLYMTPIHIDPERPALPVSHPAAYSVYLAKRLGPFATLGLAEDTWARNEGVIDDATFLEQVYDIHEERTRMFFDAIHQTRTGLVACVFDASDRIQHMFTRQGEAAADAGRIVDDMYVKMDDLVGRTRAKLRPGDVLIVMSDHGFSHFSRGVNINAWLREHGYLCAKQDAADASYLQGIDWSRTRAYTFGLSGVYLNLSGREKQGIVSPEDAGPLRQELIRELGELCDGETRAIRTLYDATTEYSGPYVADGPDIVVGFERGYRASWDGAVGKTSGPVFTDNDKPWGGDHCIDRSLVPGVLFSDHVIDDASQPAITDIAPTVLDLFGVPCPRHMDGRSLSLKAGRRIEDN